MALSKKVLLQLIIICIASGFLNCSNNVKEVNNSKFPAISGLLERRLPEHKNSFVFKEILEEGDTDVFEIWTKDGKVEISGNNEISMASGLNWYLRYYCHVRPTWDNFDISLPKELPKVKEKIRQESSVDNSYYLNYCTFNYSMSFWNWERWEKEIDFMALNGVDLPLAITGAEATWQNTLNRLGYTKEEIDVFLPGPAFNSWWLMGNLEGWGGPLPQNWIDGHVDLQKKILERMKAFGMKPILPAFYGMVPNSLIEKYPDADIRDQGIWAGGFTRPAFLAPTDPLFDKIASIFYEEQDKLFGSSEYFSGDPFHEGGSTLGIDVPKAGKNILKNMHKSSPKAKWVLMAWGHNPMNEMFNLINDNDVLILDLEANNYPKFEMHNNWGDKPFIWGIIGNFGGNTGLFGRMDATVNEFNRILNHPGLTNTNGVGVIPEAIENNPVMYELQFELKWRKNKVDLSKWLNDYAFSRYGKENQDIEEAWQVLRSTVYSNRMARNNEQQGTTESVFCARPSLKIEKVSSWGTSKLYYNPSDLLPAWKAFVAQSNEFKDSPSFEYDLVDVTRQVLANYGQWVHTKMTEAYAEKKISSFRAFSDLFLELIKDQNELLNTKTEFMLGPWIASARAWGQTKAEKDLYEFNARTLLTTWSFQDSNLHDYSHREWGGLLSDFYFPRWEMFISKLASDLKGEPSEEIDYYSFEENWNKEHKFYATEEQQDCILKADEIYNKYYDKIQASYQQNTDK
ncbi:MULTISPECIES: alpha-N-acetylglucosaminidase [Arenibacter]|uniref:alpha-N-acetylglucosaminidase n=1 Tax=Arenibacter TaxID=178469 RepID=UPI0012FFE102|nr:MULTISPECIES: alpha-N-acetylglucosaminidase [Arenibacter]